MTADEMVGTLEGYLKQEGESRGWTVPEVRIVGDSPWRARWVTYEDDSEAIEIDHRSVRPETLCHEAAHWTQFYQKGKTRCFSSPVRNSDDYVLANEHRGITNMLYHKLYPDVPREQCA